MNGTILIIIISLSVLLAVCVIAAEIVLYLTSDGHANLDFVIKASRKSDLEKLRDKLREEAMEWLGSQDTKEYQIRSKDGLLLKALYIPAPETEEQNTDQKNSDCGKRMAFCIHGIQSNGLREFAPAAKYFYDHGIGSFIVDQRACGKSEGKYVTYGAKEADDCEQWLNYIAEEFGHDMRVFVYGMSMGSAVTVLLGGRKLPANVEYLVSDCGYASVKNQMLHTFGSLNMPRNLLYRLYKCACICHRIYNPDKVYITQAAEKCNLPILFIHGDKDEVVPVENVYELYKICGSKNKKIIVTEGVGHVHSFIVSEEVRKAVWTWNEL